MADIIRLLPDSVANQIAAGEVIQRPASAVKELMENAVDSGSTSIKVLIKDAGKSLIQVIDNGSGMSETDARMCFERHTTSKIHSANDLFSIRTLGFRGEALASIAAIAEVELKTRRTEDETGTEIMIRGSQVVSQETTACPAGSNFSVKNLFYNVPARRKFLKADSTEMKHIITEFQRVALTNPKIEFSLIHNDSEILHLPETNLRQRIVHVLGKSINQQLIELNCETSLAKMKGYIGKPEFARKTMSEQFFFVNNRYMRHPYFHRAIMMAYERILPADSFPAYFIHFDVNPETIDINIHPTKTEIKFENERALWQIIYATVKESLGKFNIVPSIDFEAGNEIDIPIHKKDSTFSPPSIEVNKDFNPFREDNTDISSGNKKFQTTNPDLMKNWEKLFREDDVRIKPQQENVHRSETEGTRSLPLEENSQYQFFQLKSRYILTPVKSGLMIIDQKRAHERILFEKFMQTSKSQVGLAQQQLYPVRIEMNPADYSFIKDILDELSELGFDIRDFGSNTIVVNGCPADLKNPKPAEIIELLLQEFHDTAVNLKESSKERIAKALARSMAVRPGQTLSQKEMQSTVDELFACQSPNFSPDGKPAIAIMPLEEVEKKFR
jgi:DNA mismatch repair protein MutL